MSAHKLRITNPSSEAVLTTVELDGQQQYINGLSIELKPNARGTNFGLTAVLTYPYMPVEIELQQVETRRNYSTRLYIPGYEGVRESGHGETMEAALLDLASRVGQWERS